MSGREIPFMSPRMGGFTYQPSALLSSLPVPSPRMGGFTCQPSALRSSLPAPSPRMGGFTYQPSALWSSLPAPSPRMGGFTCQPSALRSPLPVPASSHPQLFPVNTQVVSPLSSGPFLMGNSRPNLSISPLTAVRAHNHGITSGVQKDQNEVSRLQCLLHSQSKQSSELKAQNHALNCQVETAHKELSNLKYLVQSHQSQNEELKKRVLRLQEGTEKAKGQAKQPVAPRPVLPVSKTRAAPGAATTEKCSCPDGPFEKNHQHTYIKCVLFVNCYACLQHCLEGRAHRAHGETQPHKRNCSKFKKYKKRKLTPMGHPPSMLTNKVTTGVSLAEPLGSSQAQSSSLQSTTTRLRTDHTDLMAQSLPTTGPLFDLLSTRKRKQPARKCKRKQPK